MGKKLSPAQKEALAQLKVHRVATRCPKPWTQSFNIGPRFRCGADTLFTLVQKGRATYDPETDRFLITV
jgi:hypothetical protein